MNRELEKEIWARYTIQKPRDLKRFAKEIDREHGVKWQDVFGFIQSKKAGRSRLAKTLVGAAVIGAVVSGAALYLTGGNVPAVVNESSLERKISFEEAARNIDNVPLVQAYLDQLLERRGNETKYLRSVSKLTYHLEVPADADDCAYGRQKYPVARVLRGKQKKGEKGEVEIFRYIFTHFADSEDELMSILDNESFSTALRYYGHADTFQLSGIQTKEEVLILEDFFKRFTESKIFGITHEHQSNLYQILMFKKRKVGKASQREVFILYAETARRLLEESKGTDLEKGAELFVKYASPRRISKGLVELNVK